MKDFEKEDALMELKSTKMTDRDILAHKKYVSSTNKHD